MPAEPTDAMPFNSPNHPRRWPRLPQRLLRGFLLGLTLGLALSTVGLIR